MAPTYGGESYYQVLGVNPLATPGEIKRSYRDRVRRIHPDVLRRGTDSTEFQLVKRAYDVLSDPAERDRYDMLMGLGQHAGHVRFYRRSFDRLFDNLFYGLRNSLDVTPHLSEAMDEAKRRAG
jgi:curved DNA-binding protein CbpA